MTWWLWLVLVIAALALLALLGLRLWRKGKVLLAELEALSVLGERLSAVTGSEPPPPIVPAYLAAPGVIAEARHRRAENLRERRHRRHVRAAAAFARWRRLGLTSAPRA
ncbi:hypothetical protein [Georgenia sp. H159]|uniref:hypothetical protein n=1 Tax=Georgenia sp. H159 TaxID=3076115 RepID=UPI002D78B363|nr:hypothetical protein [Georgenia sp. H159]